MTEQANRNPNATTKLTTAETGLDPELFAALGVLWRGKFWILLITLLGVLAGWGYVKKFTVPMYPATAEIALESKPQSPMEPDLFFFGPSASLQDINTEIRVIKSRKLISRLVDQLNLSQDPEFKSATLDQVIERVRGRISVENFEYSFVFNIRAITQDPEKSVKIANTLAQIYIESQLEEKFEEAETASTWLSERAADLKIELENSEAAIKEFNDRTELISPETLQAQTRQLKDLRGRLDDLKRRRDSTGMLRDTITAAVDTGDLSQIDEQSADARLGSLLSDLNSGRVVQSVFDQRLAALANQYRNDAERAAQQYDALLESERTFSREVNEQADDLVQLQQLQRETEANRLLYESFLQRLKETTVQKGLQTSDSRMLSPAVAQGASSPRPVRILGVSGILAAILGMLLVLLNDMRHNSFMAPEQLQKATGHTVLGAIPLLPTKKRKDVLKFARENPSSQFAESIRNLRTSILLSDIDKPPQVIMCTSSVPGEAKTTLSLALAQNMAGLDKKVLVIEGDIRRRMFAEIYDLKDHPSFLDVLSGKSKLQEALFRSDDLEFDILAGAKSSANAADVFSSDTFAQFIDQVRKHYDYIIIDTPPVLVVPDARVIGQQADAIIYNVLFDGPSKAMVKKGLNMIESVGLHVSGLAFSKMDIRKMGRHGYDEAYGYRDYKNYYES